MRYALLLTTLFGAAMVAACAKAPPAGVGTGTTQTAATPAPALTEEVLREKKPRIGDATVYVDGKPIAVMRTLELPIGLQPHDINRSGHVTKRYFMGEYLKALGIDVAKVKALHAYGGTRVAVVDHDELQRIQNGIQISFTQGNRGKPRLIWAVADLKMNTTIDMVSAIAIYLEKEPPTLQDRQLAFADGKPIDGIPYAPQEMSKGTRVYVDGRLVATVKRKELSNKLVVGNDLEHPRFSLAAYLDSLGVDATNAKSLDFVSGDDVILRMDSKKWDADQASFAFTLPRHNQGQVAVAAGSAKAAKVSALQVFIKTQPPARTIARAVDDSARGDDTSGPNSGGGGGGGADDEL